MKKRNEKPIVTGYDYSDRDHREETVSALFSRAKNARGMVERDWERYNDYYNFVHAVTGEMAGYSQQSDTPFTAPVIPDPWIIVESQIDPNVPEPEFRGRDDDMDSTKAKQREFAVRYIVENNRLTDMNTRNERRLLKLGDAFWKAYWDPSMRCGLNEGDIRVKDIPVESIFPDPSIRDGQLQDGQYVDYVYSVHKVNFWQMFRRELDKRGITREEVFSQDYMDTGLFDMTTAIDERDDTVQIIEHWFKQPVETVDDKGNKVPEGSIACSIQAGGKELRYIPNYWVRTGKQNNLFPFVHYWRIGDENRFWNKSELFPVMDLVDAADRKLGMATMNDAFLSNDIILVEDGALAEGTEITNEPGAVIRMKQNRMSGIARLGGLHSLANSAADLMWYKEQIERANRNYESNMGKETSRTTTATGLAMLRSDANDQAGIKKADRNAGFERLYELLDWLALEFFDDDRMLFIGANGEREAESIRFNADNFSFRTKEIMGLDGEIVRESWTYYPKVDVTITAGDSVVKGKQATLQALQALTQSQITAENWKLFAAQLEVLDIPNKQDIIREWEERFAMQPMAQQLPAGGMAQQAKMNPELYGAMQEAGIY